MTGSGDALFCWVGAGAGGGGGRGTTGGGRVLAGMIGGRKRVSGPDGPDGPAGIGEDAGRETGGWVRDWY